MCGIAAGSNLLKTFNLYSNNLYRGCYSTGVLIIDTDYKAWVLKTKGIASILELERYIHDNNINVMYILMHSRAPTNTTEQIFEKDNNHPFVYDDLYAAHNGIITNFKELNQNKALVDSSIIPVLVRKDGLQKAFERMQGLLTCWLFDEKNKNIYIIKAGSTLNISEDGYFSSTVFEGSRPVEDGSILELKDNKFNLLEKFNYTNPYYV